MQKNYLAKENRYDNMLYRRVGKSGLLLPAISLGLWHNFGSIDPFENQREMLTTAFDLGITHFDLANNYGPEAGSAEELFGLHLKKDFKKYRDELIISSKAGYYMWDGPYGEWGSRKYIIASANQSLRRMRCGYFDIFYSHRPDPETPIEETIGALNTLVQQGKALYVGISSYTSVQTKAAFEVAKDLGLKLLIHQPNYSMFDRWVADAPTGDNLLKTLNELGMGSIVFAPLSQGMLTDKYLHGIPENSRAAKETGFLSKDAITEAKLSQIHDLNCLAKERGQKLSQMALAWVLRDERVTSALIGASRKEQIVENVATLDNLEFTADELQKIDDILARDDLTNVDKRSTLTAWHYGVTHTGE
ncbi:MAG: aldo/keto reductase [Bifidobacteriaceae bacterium]|jgi:L-glyceraldehyde 3-phosphate reductase|nr:aldo/keto reductase [Bifidobacteriaceae bacterium]